VRHPSPSWFTKITSIALLGGLGTVLGIGGAPAAQTLVSAIQTREPLPSLDLASIGVTTTTTPTTAASETSACPAGTVEVKGDYCPFVEQKCLRWLDPETKMRCAEFAPTGECPTRTSHKHFCIDQYEYPNVPGTKPTVMVTWNQARDACAAEGKRLCAEQEWTLACEGSERLPYPYGYARSADACNIDRPHPNPDERLLASPKTRDAELARLDQRDPSGAHESCVSPFGAFDMTGNVDEWVVNETGRPHKSGLKGGYWGPVRDRCRPMTIAHDENFAFYQIGFRCCSDPGANVHQAPAARSAGVGEILAGS
jgi:sulfatase modifying factor 1